jgi:hypothetical protein
MNELAARIADGWAQPPSEIERAALAVIHKQVPITSHVSLAGHGPAEFGENCPDCSAMLSYIRKLLSVVEPLIEAEERSRLAGEGSLHPAGSEHRVQLELRWYRPDGTYHPRAAAEPDLDPDPLQTLRDHLRSGLPEGFVRGEIWSKEHWAGPWEVVPEEEINDG